MTFVEEGQHIERRQFSRGQALFDPRHRGVDARDHRLGLRLTAEQFGQLAGHPLSTDIGLGFRGVDGQHMHRRDALQLRTAGGELRGDQDHVGFELAEQLQVRLHPQAQIDHRGRQLRRLHPAPIAFGLGHGDRCHAQAQQGFGQAPVDHRDARLTGIGLGQARQQGEHTEQPAHQITTAMGCWPCGWLSTCMGRP